MIYITGDDLEELVEFAAKQNFASDKKERIYGPADTFANLPNDEIKTYLDEARHLLENHGENYQHEGVLLVKWKQ